MNGIIVVNKPAGLSSNTVVGIVKKAVGAKKAGHLGTLDVLGTEFFRLQLERQHAFSTFFYLNLKHMLQRLFLALKRKHLTPREELLKRVKGELNLTTFKMHFASLLENSFSFRRNLAARKLEVNRPTFWQERGRRFC